MKNNTNKAMEKVIDKILEKLENGSIPWCKPWETWASWSRLSGGEYHGVNVLTLSGGEYATFKQIKDENGKINKGAKAEEVVYYKEYNAKPTADELGILNQQSGDECFIGSQLFKKDNGAWVKPVRMMKYYNVFNIENCTDMKVKKEGNRVKHSWNGIEKAEDVLQAYTKKSGIPVIYGSNKAYNRQGFNLNEIVLPKREQFKTAQGFYSTVFHECIHSTGKQLKRNMGGAFGSKAYAREELVAEIGSAYIMSFLGLEDCIENTAAYCENWRNHLTDDKNALFYAAPKALDAANYILESVGISPTDEPENEPKGEPKASEPIESEPKASPDVSFANTHKFETAYKRLEKSGEKNGLHQVINTEDGSLIATPHIFVHINGTQALTVKEGKIEHGKLLDLFTGLKTDDRQAVCEINAGDIIKTLRQERKAGEKLHCIDSLFEGKKCNVYVNSWYLQTIAEMLGGNLTIKSGRPTQTLHITGEHGEALLCPVRVPENK